MLRLAFPLGKVDFVSPLVKQRTDEGRPSETVVTSKSVALAAAPSAPSEGFGFRAPPVADAARKASRCRPQVRERIAEARAENGEGAKLARPKDLEARLRER